MSVVLSAGPYVGVAVLCDALERRADGATDLKNIRDVIVLDSPFLGSAPVGVRLQLLAIVGLRAGEIRGEHTVAVRAHYPTRRDGEMIARLVEFTDDAPSCVMVFQLDLHLDQAGDHWFDVLFNGRRLTRIPLSVRRAQLTSPPDIPSNPIA